MKTNKSDLAKILRLNGYIMPSSDDEIKAFEEKYKKLYDKPENWDTPLEIIKKGKQKIDLKVTKSNTSETDNLAMAAREGKSISKEVKNKMQKDRENGEKNNDFLSIYDKESLNELASSIAEFHFPRGLINPEIIAEKNNITYSYGNYEDSFDGLIEFKNNKFHIYINIDRLGHAYTERARFTFAHELGHFFIDSHRNALVQGQSPSHGSFTGFVNKNRAERQADYFASCLLLPESKIHKDCYRRKFNFSLIQELSKKYQTSISATALRFSAIGNHPIMVVYSKNNEIVWYWSSDDFPYWKLKNGKYKVPEDTVVGEYFNLSRKPKNTQTVFAMDWFSNVWQSHTNREFKEHCLYHGNQVLSIVWEE